MSKPTYAQEPSFLRNIARLSRFFLDGKINPEGLGKERISTVTPEQAAEIMGQNFYSLEDVKQLFDSRFTEEELEDLAVVPYSMEILEENSWDHVLIPCTPVSLMEMEYLFTRSKFRACHWYVSQEFANTPAEVGWKLVDTTPVLDSMGKSWEQQLDLLSKEEDVPSAVVLAQVILLHYQRTGQKLFDYGYVRTADVDNDHRRVLLGSGSGLSRLVIGGDWGSSEEYTGLASHIKPG